jgi:hypothetical protein
MGVLGKREKKEDGRMVRIKRKRARGEGQSSKILLTTLRQRGRCRIRWHSKRYCKKSETYEIGGLCQIGHVSYATVGEA